MSNVTRSPLGYSSRGQTPCLRIISIPELARFRSSASPKRQEHQHSVQLERYRTRYYAVLCRWQRIYITTTSGQSVSKLESRPFSRPCAIFNSRASRYAIELVTSTVVGGDGDRTTTLSKRHLQLCLSTVLRSNLCCKPF